MNVERSCTKTDIIVTTIIIDFFFLIHSFVKQTLIVWAISKGLRGNANHARELKNQVRVSDGGYLSFVTETTALQLASKTKQEKQVHPARAKTINMS